MGRAGVAVDHFGRLFVADGADNAIIWQFTPNGTNWDVKWLPPTSGFSGWIDGSETEARFKNPTGLALDAAGNLYVADWGNNAIRKLTPQGTKWMISTLAGNPTAGYADGMGTNALFNGPTSVAVDAAGNVFVADSLNHAIRKITPAGLVTTFAGGPQTGSADGVGTNAQFELPHGVVADSFGNVFVADMDGSIRKITPDGEVTTVAGLADKFGHADGLGSAARFNEPYGIAVDNVGNLYVAEFMGFNISKGVPAQELQIHNTGGGVQLDVTGPIGSSYAVEYTDALSGTASWQALTTLTLTNTVQSVTDSNVPSPTQRFYRTVQSQ
jgi:sugar lactone lactonase YvrE